MRNEVEGLDSSPTGSPINVRASYAIETKGQIEGVWKMGYKKGS